MPTSAQPLRGAAHEAALVVELEGTLLESDVRLAMLLSLLRQNLAYLLVFPLWLLRGPRFFRQELQRRASLDVRWLAYDQRLVSYLTQERQLGREVLLVTALDADFARSVAEHLGFTHVVARGKTRSSASSALREALAGRDFIEISRGRGEVAAEGILEERPRSILALLRAMRAHELGLESVFWLSMPLALFACCMTGGLVFDEGMYVTAGRLARDSSMYRDFAYLQTPYQPLLLGWLFQITPTGHYLLVARTASFGFLFLATYLMYVQTRKLVGARHPVAPLCVAMFFAGNQIVGLRMGTSCNDMMALALAIWAACWLLPLFQGDPARRALRAFGGGLLFAAAAGTKLLHAPLLLAAGVVLAVSPAPGHPRRPPLVAYAAGVLVGLLPVAVYFARGAQSFWFDVVKYHQLNAQWREIAGHSGASLMGKAKVVASSLAMPTCAATAVVGAGLLVVSMKSAARERRPLVELFPSHVRFLAALSLGSCALALVLSPLWKHYFMPAVPFALLIGVVWYDRYLVGARDWLERSWVGLAVLVTLLHGARLAHYLPRLATPSRWTALQAHQEGEKIRAAVLAANRDVGPDARVATLFPLYAVESGMLPYSELSTGALLYRIADDVPRSTRAAVVATSPRTVFQLLERNPPAAVLVGFEREHRLEEPLDQYARAYGYHPANAGLREGTLYVRPPSPGD